MEGTSGIGLGDAMLLANQGKDGWAGGGCFFWVIILFWLMCGNNGWGNNNRNYATQQDVYAAADNQNLENSIRDVARQINQVGDGLASSTFALNNTINNGFTGVMRDSFTLQQAMMGGMNNIGQAINENRFAAQQCCCETNRNIDSVKYAEQINAGNIQQAIHNEGEETRKLIVANQMQDLRDRLAERDRELQTVNFALSQQVQNQTIIGAVRPFPLPAYPVGNPYGANAVNVCGCAAYNNP